MKGMMDGWHGDEYEVEYTLEELDDIACQKADEQNDEDWVKDILKEKSLYSSKEHLDSYQGIINTLSNPSGIHTNPPNCSDIGVFTDIGVEHE